MKKLILLLFVVFSFQAFSQFTITGVDSKDYPLVKTNFFLNNPGGNPIEGFSEVDFEVIENGQDLSASVMVSCLDTIKEPDLSILLVLDESGSMELQPGETERRWDWVIDAVDEFLQNINFEGETKVAVTTFERQSTLQVDFTNDVEEIMEAVEAVEPFGPTRYNEPFMEETVGAYDMLTKRPANMKRVVIFLTDGQPDEPPRTQEIIDTMNTGGISVFTITMLTPMTTTLAKIARETNGKSFEVDNRDDLAEIYQLIAQELQKSRICELSWISQNPCLNEDGKIDLSLRYIPRFEPILKSYQVEPENKVNLEANPSIINFLNPEIDLTVTKTTTFTARNGASVITNLELIPSDYYTIDEIRKDDTPVASPITLADGEFVEIDISFTQRNEKVLREADLKITTEACEYYTSILGGLSEVILTGPNGGEIFNSCETVDISWIGLEVTQEVNIYYSDDNGANWNTIAQNVSGTNYQWNPPAVGVNYLVKVELPEQNYIAWVREIESSTYSSSVDIAFNLTENFIYAGGAFREDVTLDTISFGAFGDDGFSDAWIGMFNKTGNIQWAHRVASRNDDSVTTLVADNDGNVWVAGIMGRGARFGALIPSLEYFDTPYMFIVKLNQNGDFLGYKTYGAEGGNTDALIWPEGIRVLGNGDIELVGYYKRQIKVKDFPETVLPYSVQDQDNDRTNRFVMKFRGDVEFVSGIQSNFNRNNFGIYELEDQTENKFTSSNYKDQLSLGNINLNSANQKGIIYRETKIQTSEDVSESNFKVINPVLTLNQDNLDFGVVKTGESGARVFTNLVTNNTETPYTVSDFYFQAGTEQDWNVTVDFNDPILPGESRTIEFAFIPKVTGLLVTQFNIIPDCGDPLVINLSGTGQCFAEAPSILNLAKRSLNIRSQIIFNDVISNSSLVDIQINPIIENDPQNEFEVFAIDGNGDEQVQLTIAPGENADIVVYFTAKQLGLRTADLNYGLDAACEELISNLEGEGVASQIIGDPLIIENRIRTFNSGSLEIQNFGESNTRISNLRFENTSTIYQLVNLQSDYTIAPTQIINIDYEFISENEFNENTKLLADLENGSTIEIMDVNFIASNPTTVLSLECPSNVSVGETRITKLSISNTSAFEDANLFYIESNNPEFTFSNGNTRYDFDPTDFVDLNDVYELDITVRPQSEGDKNVEFTLSSDVAIGWGADDTYAADSLSTYAFTCSAGSNNNFEVDNFGNYLVCNSYQLSFEVVNPTNNQLILEIDNILLSGDVTDFEIVDSGNLILEPNGNQIINFNFKPITTGDKSITYEIPNNLGIKLEGELNASSVEIQLSGRTSQQGSYPGSPTQAWVEAIIPDLATGDINNLTLVVDTKSLMLDIDETSILTDLPDWTWNNIDSISSTKLVISGEGNLNVPSNGKIDILSYFYKLYLEKQYNTNVEYYLQGTLCDQDPDDAFDVVIDGVCLPNFKLLELSPGFGINSVYPNPIDDDFTMTFSVPSNDKVKIQIFDINGNVVREILNASINPGTYETIVNTDNLSHGVYYLRISTSFDTKTKKLIK